MSEETPIPPSTSSMNPPGGGEHTPQPGPRRHMPAEARREQILSAALTCFAEKGFHASTMDDLVRASGLSKGSLYWHFSSKEEVFLALVDSFTAELYGAWDDIAESDDDKLEVLKRECETSVRRFADERLFLLAWAEFFTHPAGRERLRDAYEVARGKFEAIVEAGRANGSLCDGPPAPSVASTLVATFEGIFLQWLVDPDFSLEEQAAHSWELLEKGLRP